MSRILVVDDDIVLRDLLEEILRTHGHGVEVAGTADEAAEKLRRGPAFDLVTIDLVLPGGKTGLDVVVVVQTMLPRPKFLVVSGMIPEHVKRQLRELGVSRSQILAKPFGVDTFVRKVRKQLMS